MDDDSIKEKVTNELQRRGLAAADLPEGEPERAATDNAMSMAKAQRSRREPQELSTTHHLPHPPLPWPSQQSRRGGTVAHGLVERDSSSATGTGTVAFCGNCDADHARPSPRAVARRTLGQPAA